MQIGAHNYSDEDLLQLLKNDHAAAFDSVYNRYWSILYNSAYTRVNDEDVAKDIVQNVFIEIWQRRKRLDITSSLKQYLHGAVKLKVLQHYRSENIKQQVLENAADLITQMMQSNQNLAAYFDLERIVSEEKNKMPANMKNSLLLRNDSLPVKEIARNLNLAEQTVSNNITEALKRLKKRIKREYPERFIGFITLLTLYATKT